MKRRIFIAINLPDNIKEKLVNYQKDIDNSFAFFNGFCPVRWTRKESLHITLFFVGNIDLQELEEVIRIIEESVSGIDPFDIKLNSVTYAPKDNPKMIWANGLKTESLDKLQKAITEKMGVKENMSFSLHITLGRITRWKFAKISEEERPEVKKDIDLELRVNSIDVMESFLKRGGPEYINLKSFEL